MFALVGGDDEPETAGATVFLFVVAETQSTCEQVMTELLGNVA